jgi:hypothetical protein
MHYCYSIILSYSEVLPPNKPCIENCALLGYYAVTSGNSLPTFRYNLLVPFQILKRSRGFWPLKMGPIGCPKTSIRNYHYSLHNNPEKHSSHPPCSWSLKSHKPCLPTSPVFFTVNINSFTSLNEKYSPQFMNYCLVNWLGDVQSWVICACFTVI